MNYQDVNDDEEFTDMEIREAWWYKFIIPLDNRLYNLWEIFIGMLSIICSFNYAYFAAFDFPYKIQQE